MVAIKAFLSRQRQFQSSKMKRFFRKDAVGYGFKANFEKPFHFKWLKISALVSQEGFIEFLSQQRPTMQNETVLYLRITQAVMRRREMKDLPYEKISS